MYAQKTFSDRLRTFDVYKQLPKKYLQPTFIGAICKILSIIFFLNSNRANNYNVNIFIHVRIQKLFHHKNKK